MVGYRQRSLAFMVMVGLTFPAHADETSKRDPETQRALEHNQNARKLFNLGLFQQAAAEYRKAYAAKASPDFLYNLAQCHIRLDTLPDLKKGTHYLESYIKSAPFSPIRESTEKELERLRQTIKKREAATTKKAQQGTPFYHKWWFWTGVGVLVAGATTAAIVVTAQPDDPVSGTADPGILRLPIRIRGR